RRTGRRFFLVRARKRKTDKDEQRTTFHSGHSKKQTPRKIRGALETDNRDQPYSSVAGASSVLPFLMTSGSAGTAPSSTGAASSTTSARMCVTPTTTRSS